MNLSHVNPCIPVLCFESLHPGTSINGFIDFHGSENVMKPSLTHHVTHHSPNLHSFYPSFTQFTFILPIIHPIYIHFTHHSPIINVIFSPPLGDLPGTLKRCLRNAEALHPRRAWQAGGLRWLHQDPAAVGDPAGRSVRFDLHRKI